MRSLHALWRTIEREAVLAGVEAQWQLWLGDDIDVARAFLKPEQNLASSYPCEHHPGACARRVVHHGPDDVVAVCGLDESECERLALKRADVVVYGLALTGLLAEVATALSCSGAVERINGTRAWSLGTRSGAQLFFVLPEREAGYAAPLATLLSRYPTGDLAALVPSQDSLAPADRALLSQRRAAIFSCDDLLEVDDDGQLTRRAPGPYVIPPTEVLTVRDGGGDYERKPIAICWRHDSDAPVTVSDNPAELDRVARAGARRRTLRRRHPRQAPLLEEQRQEEARRGRPDARRDGDAARIRRSPSCRARPRAPREPSRLDPFDDRVEEAGLQGDAPQGRSQHDLAPEVRALQGTPQSRRQARSSTRSAQTVA